MRLSWLRTIVAGVACLLGALGVAAEPAPAERRVILADDLGYSDLGCYGGEIATPNLDALADERPAVHAVLQHGPLLADARRRSSPATTPSRSAATPCPASTSGGQGVAAGVGAAAARDAQAARLPLVPLRQVARRRQAARRAASTTRTASRTTTASSARAAHVEDDKPLPPVEPRQRLLRHHGHRRPRDQVPEGARRRSTPTSRSSSTSRSPRRTSRCTPCRRTSPGTATRTAPAGTRSASERWQRHARSWASSAATLVGRRARRRPAVRTSPTR